MGEGSDTALLSSRTSPGDDAKPSMIAPLVFSVLPLAIGLGLAEAIYRIDPDANDYRAQAVKQYELHFALFALTLFGALTRFLNFYAGPLKGPAMDGRAKGNIRANMFIFKVSALNARFVRDPATAAWGAGGTPADAAVLVHALDGREDPAEPWRPWRPRRGPYTADYLKESGSYIYAGQQQANARIPLFSDGVGLVFRPSATRVFCGFGGDAGGKGVCYPREGRCLPGCGNPPTWCDPTAVHLMGNQAGTCYDRPWRPADFGTLLGRARAREGYNEVIIDSLAWDAGLPDTLDAIYYTATGGAASRASAVAAARWAHAAFLTRYRVSAETHPLVVLDLDRWDGPFRADAGAHA